MIERFSLISEYFVMAWMALRANMLRSILDHARNSYWCNDHYYDLYDDPGSE